MYVLFIYLATWSANGGMATATHEFPSQAACVAAATNVNKEFGGIYTRVFTFCVNRDTGAK
jgi:hypothetical protein